MKKKLKRKIGFSQGCLHGFDFFSEKILDVYLKNSDRAIEVHFKTDKVDELEKIILDIKKFKYVSIHLPTDFRYGNNKETKEFLDKIYRFYLKIKAKLAVIHPNSVVGWEVFDNYEMNWAIENMDYKQVNYKYLEDFEKFFIEKNNWKMVLDLNHCFTNDKSMVLAKNFIDKLGSRIAEFHISGFVDFHESLYKTDQKIILDFCKELDVPLIIESGFGSVEELQKEINYIRNNLLLI